MLVLLRQGCRGGHGPGISQAGNLRPRCRAACAPLPPQHTGALQSYARVVLGVEALAGTHHDHPEWSQLVRELRERVSRQ